MHLGLFCTEYPPAPHGGIGSSNQDLAEGLVAAGHRVTVVGIYAPASVRSDRSDGPDAAGLRIVRLPSSPEGLPYRLRALLDRWRARRWLQREQARNPFDLIEIPDYDGWLPWGGPREVPLLCRLHGTNAFFDRELGRPGNAFEHGLERRSLVRSDFWIGVSHYALKRTLELCDLRQKESAVIHQAVDVDLFSPGAAVPTEPGLVVFVNSLSPKKGIEQLLEAMNLVFPKHPRARLAVVGQGARAARGGADYAGQLPVRVRPEFRARVEFAGRQDRQTGVVNYLRRAHLCCLPSHMETFGIAAVEAMSVGKPTVYSRTGPGPEVIEDGVSGLLCDPHDPADIAAKILAILNDRALAETLGKNARSRVERLFSKQDWVKRNVALFESRLAAIN